MTCNAAATRLSRGSRHSQVVEATSTTNCHGREGNRFALHRRRETSTLRSTEIQPGNDRYSLSSSLQQELHYSITFEVILGSKALLDGVSMPGCTRERCKTTESRPFP